MLEINWNPMKSCIPFVAIYRRDTQQVCLIIYELNISPVLQSKLRYGELLYLSKLEACVHFNSNSFLAFPISPSPTPPARSTWP